jgi:hypothetical protein
MVSLKTIIDQTEAGATLAGLQGGVVLTRGGYIYKMYLHMYSYFLYCRMFGTCLSLPTAHSLRLLRTRFSTSLPFRTAETYLSLLLPSPLGLLGTCLGLFDHVYLSLLHPLQDYLEHIYLLLLTTL